MAPRVPPCVCCSALGSVGRARSHRCLRGSCARAGDSLSGISDSATSASALSDVTFGSVQDDEALSDLSGMEGFHSTRPHPEEVAGAEAQRETVSAIADAVSSEPFKEKRAEDAAAPPKTDTAATKKTRGALLAGLKSGKLEEAVAKMEDDLAGEDAAKLVPANTTESAAADHAAEIARLETEMEHAMEEEDYDRCDELSEQIHLLEKEHTQAAAAVGEPAAASHATEELQLDEAVHVDSDPVAAVSACSSLHYVKPNGTASPALTAAEALRLVEKCEITDDTLCYSDEPGFGFETWTSWGHCQAYFISLPKPGLDEIAIDVNTENHGERPGQTAAANHAALMARLEAEIEHAMEDEDYDRCDELSTELHELQTAASTRVEPGHPDGTVVPEETAHDVTQVETEIAEFEATIGNLRGALSASTRGTAEYDDMVEVLSALEEQQSELQLQHGKAAAVVSESEAVVMLDDFGFAGSEDEVSAAARIQSLQRGKQTRREMAEQQQAATKMQAVQRGKTSRKLDRSMSGDLSLDFSSHLDFLDNAELQKAESERSILERNGKYVRDDSARKIQRAFRDRSFSAADDDDADGDGEKDTGAEMLRRQKQHVAATAVQSRHRGAASRRHVAEIKRIRAANRYEVERLQSKHHAATRMQSRQRGRQARVHAANAAEVKRVKDEKLQQQTTHGHNELSTVADQEEQQAATNIQRMHRGRKARSRGDDARAIYRNSQMLDEMDSVAPRPNGLNSELNDLLDDTAAWTEGEITSEGAGQSTVHSLDGSGRIAALIKLPGVEQALKYLREAGVDVSENELADMVLQRLTKRVVAQQGEIEELEKNNASTKKGLRQRRPRSRARTRRPKSAVVSSLASDTADTNRSTPLGSVPKPRPQSAVPSQRRRPHPPSGRKKAAPHSARQSRRSPTESTVSSRLKMSYTREERLRLRLLELERARIELQRALYEQSARGDSLERQLQQAQRSSENGLRENLEAAKLQQMVSASVRRPANPQLLLVFDTFDMIVHTFPFRSTTVSGSHRSSHC